ncbi:MAG: hypothetical protein ACLUQJ_02895 [Alphaproteobacteria bacterium]
MSVFWHNNFRHCFRHPASAAAAPAQCGNCRFSPEVDETLALKSIALVRLLNPRVTLTASPVLCNLPEAPFLEQLLAGADTVATSVMLPSMLSEICFHIKTCGFTVNRDFEK